MKLAPMNQNSNANCRKQKSNLATGIRETPAGKRPR